jgi:hypothetical protein
MADSIALDVETPEHPASILLALLDELEGASGILEALSVIQPFATYLAATPDKRFETRSWSTSKRGIVAIHASKGWPAPYRKFAERTGYCDLLERHGFAPDKYGRGALRGLPLGSIIGVANLTDCLKVEDIRAAMALRDFTEADRMELALGDFAPRRFGLKMEDKFLLPEPIPATGALNFWKVPEEARAEIRRQLEAAA